MPLEQVAGDATRSVEAQLNSERFCASAHIDRSLLLPSSEIERQSPTVAVWREQPDGF